MKALRVPTGLAVGEFDNLHLGASWWAPDAQRSKTVFVCLAGGGMRREYFDLAAGSNANFSFVASMRAYGHGLLLVDHPGVGDSDAPGDGYLLDPYLIAQAHHLALQQLHQVLPELAQMHSIGVGHSMGAMITLIQQARYASHRAIALLGFGFDGLPAYLPPAARDLLDDRLALEAASAELARAMFKLPYPVIPAGGNGGIYGGTHAADGAVAAIKAVSTHLLPVPAFMSMYPHHWDALAGKINVPVLLALGDQDLVRAPDNVEHVFSASPAVDVMVLPETGHSQFVFATRTDLFAQIGQWPDRLKEEF